MSEVARGLAAAVAVEAADDDLSTLDLSGVFELLSDETRLGIVRELAVVNADETAENGTKYYYRVTTVNPEDEESAASNEVERTPFSDPNRP